MGRKANTKTLSFALVAHVGDDEHSEKIKMPLARHRVVGVKPKEFVAHLQHFIDMCSDQRGEIYDVLESLSAARDQGHADALEWRRLEKKNPKGEARTK